MNNGPPDWPALYERNKDAMHRVAARVLAEGGIADQKIDAVQDAMIALMSSPPQNVRNWQAVMVTAAKRKAIDRLRSAGFRHAGPALDDRHDRPSEDHTADDVIDAVDRQRASAHVWDALSVLDDNHRKAVWEYIALQRPRAEVAAELGITPPRVNQLVKKALEQLRDELQRQGVSSDE